MTTSKRKKSYIEVPYVDNTGGLNSKASVGSFPDKDAVQLDNIHLDTNGAWVKRKGHERRNLTSISASITGIYDYVKKDGTRAIIVTAGTQVYKYNTSTLELDSIATGLTNGLLWGFETFTDLLILTNGTDNVKKYDGTTFADLGGSPPKGKFLKLFNNYLFLAGNSTDPSRLYYSNKNNPEVWTSGDHIDINPDDGDQISGLAALFDQLVIFKRNSIYTLSGDSPSIFKVSQITSDVGCLAQNSIQNITDDSSGPDSLYFYGERGVYAFRGTGVDYISEKIEDLISSGPDSPTPLNLTRLSKAASCHNRKRNQHWIALTPSGGSNNTIIFVYDYLNNAWTKFTGITGNALAYVADPLLSGIPIESQIVWTGDGTGFVSQADTGLNDPPSADISITIKTKAFDLKRPRFNLSGIATKLFRYAYIFVEDAHASGVTLTVEWFVDFAATATGSYSLTGVNSRSVHRVPLDGAAGRYIQFKITESSQRDFSLGGLSIVANERGFRG